MPYVVPIEDGWLKTNVNRQEVDIYLFSYGHDYKKALKTLFYVSEKVPLLMQPYTSRMGSAVLSELVIRLYPGEAGECILYEDDGISEAYQNGQWLKTRLAGKREGDAVEPFGDGYAGMPQTRRCTLELVGFGRALAPDRDGETSFEDDKTTVRLGEYPIREIW